MTDAGARRDTTPLNDGSPLRVLAFSDVAPPEGTGGVERTLDAIYSHLAPGAEVQIVTLSSLPRSRFFEPTPAGVQVTRVSRLPLERFTGLQVAVSLAVWPATFKLIRRWRPTVLHAHTLFFFTTLVAAAASIIFRIPLVLTVHVGSMNALPPRQRLLVKAYEQSIGRALLLIASRVICVSDDVGIHVRSLGARKRKVIVIPNGVDLSRFDRERRAATPPVVLCVGRLILNKGPMDLLVAARILFDQGREFMLQFAGDGQLEEELKARTAELGLSDRVAFLGPRDDVDCLLASAAVFVRPSLTDGMSLALLEAMAAGIPIVATRVSGAAQLITNGENGRLVAPGHPSSLAAAIAALLDDREQAECLGVAARDRARAFRWDVTARQTEDVLRDASR